VIMKHFSITLSVRPLRHSEFSSGSPGVRDNLIQTVVFIVEVLPGDAETSSA
jgi:hypothetical protein